MKTQNIHHVTVHDFRELAREKRRYDSAGLVFCRQAAGIAGGRQYARRIRCLRTFALIFQADFFGMAATTGS